ncbi:MAG: hypothetical protein NTX22_17615 [Ignavibacteriales bacterium]|nr:hypothetical protein [Ignavibacteriales bacterium]
MQKRIIDKIYLTFEKLISGDETNPDINLLFQASYNIAREYLNKNHHKYNFLNNRLDCDFNDAIMEIITALFLERNGRKYDRLLSAYNKWEPPIRSNSDALFFLHQLIFIRAEHHLSKALGKVDPLYAIALKEINDKIIQFGFYKVRHFGQCYISEMEQITPGQKLSDRDQLEQLPSYIFTDADCPKSLFVYLKSETDYFPAVPLNALALRITKLNEPKHNAVADDSITETVYTEELMSNSLNASIIKLVKSYVSTNKINGEEAELLTSALKDIAFDIKDGGINIGLYEYVKKYNAELSRENYKNKYDNILEYLVKIMKQTAKDLLAQDR